MSDLRIVHGNILQTAFTVPALIPAIEDFGKRLNIGRWFVSRTMPFSKTIYRGRPTTLKLAVALAFQGEMMYELIEPQSNDPSVYKDTIDRTGFGFHHFAIVSPAIDDEIARYRDEGCELAFEGYYGGSGRAVAYLDTRRILPGMLEVLQDDTGLRALLNMIYQKQRDCDRTPEIIER